MRTSVSTDESGAVELTLCQLLDDALVPLGFRRRGRSWTRTGHPVVAMVNLQREHAPASLFLNVAFTPASDPAPKALRQFQFRARAERMQGVSTEVLRALEQALRGEPLDRDALKTGLIDPVRAVMHDVTDMGTLLEAMTSRFSRNVFVHVDLQRTLERQA